MGLGLGSIITAGNAIWGHALWTAVRPGPSLVGEYIGWGTGIAANYAADKKYTWSKEKLSDETLQKIDTVASRVVKWCETLRSTRLAKTSPDANAKETIEQNNEESWWNVHTRAWKDFTKTRIGRFTSWVIVTIAPNAVVAVEKSVRLAAYKVERFFHLKTFDLAKAAGYKEITDALNSSTVFSTLHNKKDKIQQQNRTIVVDARLQTLNDEIQTILRDNIPATGERPTWGQTIGFGLGWGTQIGITWMLRLYAYHWAMGFVPAELRFDNIALIGCGLYYLNGLAAHTRSQIRALDKEIKTKRLDCRNLLSDSTIETIVDTARNKLEFLDSHLKKSSDNPWDELKAKLQTISTAKKPSDPQAAVGTLGAISDDEGEVEKTPKKKGIDKQEIQLFPQKEKEEEAKDKGCTLLLPKYAEFEKPNAVQGYINYMLNESKTKEGHDEALRNLRYHNEQLKLYIGEAKGENNKELKAALKELKRIIKGWIAQKQIVDIPFTPILASKDPHSTQLNFSNMQEVSGFK